MTFRMKHSARLLAGIGLMAPALAQAQVAPEPVAEAPQAETGSSSGIEDIVVTAQRREQSIQSVPLSVVAVSAEALQKSGVMGTGDLQTAVTGLTMPVSRNVLTPYLRGVGTQDSGGASESAVATYVDGVYVATPSGGTLSFTNVERIEVLKGPQGTLFGRNATGGLLQVVTADPSYDPVFNANIGYGNYDTISGGFYGSVGLTDTLAVGLAGFATDQGKGWGKNLTLGNDVNYTNEFGLRGKVLFEPDEVTRIILAGDYGERRSDMGAVRHIMEGKRNSLGVLSAGDIYDTQGGEVRDVFFRQWGVSLNISRDLGWATLKSTTAYRDYLNYLLQDGDQGPQRVVQVSAGEITTSFQQELLLTGRTGALDFTAGLFYFNAEHHIRPLAIRSELLAALNTDQFTSGITDSYAAFAQGTYSITDSTRFTAGLRYTIEKNHGYATQLAADGNALPVGTPIQSVDSRQTDKKLTYRLAIDQDLAQGVMAYASYSRGFKSGSVNLFSPFQPITRPETLDAYEVGIKSDLFDRTVRLNLAGFHYDYSDIQLLKNFGSTSVLVNAAKSRLRGAEFELSIAPRIDTGSLRFDANVTYLDGKYVRFTDAPITVPLPGGGNQNTTGDASGNRMIRTPPWTFTLTADYSVPVDGLGELGFTASYYYNDGFYWEPDNRIREPSYGLVNAQVRLTSPDGAWEAALFGRNLFDKKYAAYTVESSFLDGQAPGAPRTYGVKLSYRFGN